MGYHNLKRLEQNSHVLETGKMERLAFIRGVHYAHNQLNPNCVDVGGTLRGTSELGDYPIIITGSGEYVLGDNTLNLFLVSFLRETAYIYRGPGGVYAKKDRQK